jgi:hypothetical protein
MLVLLCVQVVQINNNESNWKEKRKKILVQTTNICELAKNEIKKKQKKQLVDKIHKLIVKELKLNINCHIKTSKNHNLFQV